MNARVLLAIVDITEEKQSQEKSLEAKNAAQLASQSKSDFLANMSHEIRTPLSAIFGYSELLANPNQTKSDALQSICRIQKNIVDIMELVDEILDISKIEAGKLEVERIRCELLPELSEIFILLDDRAKGRGLSFNVTFEGSIPKTVLVCPSRLRQILFNLVGNALKFTTDGGVTVRVKLEKNEVESASGAFLTFFITDTGCGISLEQQDRLFRHFSQADASIVRKYGGSGLGLLLSRRLAEALGGGVYLENSGLGQGSTFVFRLDPGPLDDLSMMKGIEDADLKIAKDASRDVFSANQRLKDIHVLLVEDSFDIQMLMKHMLEASGAIVSSAINGAKAIMMATKNEYDVVLMDMQMPVLDGYEATKQLRAKGYMIPIIALTANAMRGERDRCLAIGCVEYISKPVKANHLIDIVERFGKK